ncbi:MAG: glutamyl-tRNA reductase [Ignavibacteria bacterium]|nr:glutamyl-tRNA reductase [Ignavibacteria bacterium]
MDLLGISINHRTADISLREKLFCSPEEIRNLIPELKKNIFSEGVVISTCNRTEIFGIPVSDNISYSDILNFIKDWKKINDITEKNIERYFSCSAVKHIFNVSAGIDSMIPGDSQILGQVKEAFTISSDNNFSELFINRLSDTAIKVGKRTISETKIGEGAVTISYAAVQVIGKIFSNLDKKSALVIGAGQTASLAANHLKDKNIGKIFITNRTLANSIILADKTGAVTIPFEEFKLHLHKFDIIISATSSPGFLLSEKEIKESMIKRRNNPVCIMDIALPRDISPEARDIEYVFYNDIDSLKNIVDENIKRRKTEIIKIDNIIMEEMISFHNWCNNLNIVPAIKLLREFFEDIGNDELNKIKNKVTEDDYIKLEAMTKRLIGRLLHNPTMKLKSISESSLSEQEKLKETAIIKEIFGLNGKIENKALN